MYDTVACFCVPNRVLPDDAFEGGSLNYDFSRTTVTARLWRNPAPDTYAPRVTYWRPAGERRDADQPTLDELPDTELSDVGVLKFEVSLPKLLAYLHNDRAITTTNLTHEQALSCIEPLDRYLADCIDADLPSVATWVVQRVDYTWMWDVGHYLAPYMGVVSRLRLGDFTRHPYDGAEGVVWKSRGTRGRWLKFYDKERELGLVKGVGRVMRFEMSNYRDACRYMAARWFDCTRTLTEMLDPQRAVYAMCMMWDRLGLGQAGYGGAELELQRISEAFGSRTPQAWYVLNLIREYGTMSFHEPLSLVSKDKYYRYRRELVDNGLIAASTNEDDKPAPTHTLDPLHLPVELFNAGGDFRALQNLEERPNLTAKGVEKLRWKILRQGTKLGHKAPPSTYLIERIGSLSA